MGNGDLVRSTRGVATRDHEQTAAFGAASSRALVETAASAVAAAARAQIEAQYVMAERHPRDWDDVRSTLLRECQRPSFARVARYNKPVGKGVVGPSIRFAEAAIRAMHNVSIETPVLYDDREKRVLRVTVTDLEANVPYSKDITVDKTVERLSLRDGQVPIRARQNSQNKTVYLIEANDDEVMTKEAAMVSKTLRTLALRLLPGDILDECMLQVVATQNKADAADPAAGRKALADAFMPLGVKPSELKRYLGHELEQATPAGMADLRAIYAAIRDGETTWSEVVEAKLAQDEEAGVAPAADAAPADAAQATPANLAERVKAEAAAQRAKEAPVAEQSPAEAAPVAPEEAPTSGQAPTSEIFPPEPQPVHGGRSGKK